MMLEEAVMRMMMRRKQRCLKKQILGVKLIQIPGVTTGEGEEEEEE